MRKELELDSVFPRTGEPTVQLVAFTRGDGRFAIEKRAFVESQSGLYDVLKTVQPEPGISYLLMNALGAWETYDENKNGDGFPERPFKVGQRAVCGHPDCTAHSNGWIAEHEVLTKHYKTFESGGIYKHHCFPAGTEVLLKNRVRQPIETVEVGDRVVTHNGAGEVSRVLRRRYDGPGVALTLRGQLDPLTVTHGHPVYVLRREQVHCRHGYSRLTPSQHIKNCLELREAVENPEWVNAESVLPGDYLLLRPPTHGTKTPARAFAALVGWVASEGYLGANGAIQFTFSENNLEDIESVCACLAALGVHVTRTPRTQYGCTMLSACSKELHQQLSCYVAGVLDEKRLTGAVLNWSRDSLLQLLGAYIDGDGHVARSGMNRGQLRIRSSSRGMLRALSDIIRALGAPVTTNWDKPVGEMVSPTNHKTYQHNGSGCVAVAPDYVAALTVHSRKHLPHRTEGVTRGFMYEGYHLVQVTERDDIEINEDVYNLEVESDHSYVAGEVVVHNCNKDPTKSLGTIPHALWNTRMHRVELLLRVVNERAPEIIQRIADGDYPAGSMGCNVRWDVCSICGHRAPTRAQYCAHALQQMRQVLPDGRKVCVLNPSPRFFDISFVFRPADSQGWLLQKVAERPYTLSADLGAALEAFEHSRRPFELASDEIQAAWSGATPLGREVQASLLKVAYVVPVRRTDPRDLLFSPRLLAQGEVAKLAALSFGWDIPEASVDRLVLATPQLVRFLGRYPELVKQADLGDVGNVLRQRLFKGEIAGVGPGALYRAAEPAKTDLFTITDPYTGHTYQTTRGAAMDAGREDSNNHLRNTALLTALYAGGLHHLLGRRTLRTLAALPVAAYAGHRSARGVERFFQPYRNPYYATDQGIPVSGGTEFKQAADLTPLTWAEKLAFDGVERAGPDGLSGLAQRIAASPHGLDFLKWASLPLDRAADLLVFGAETYRGLDATRLSRNFATLFSP